MQRAVCNLNFKNAISLHRTIQTTKVHINNFCYIIPISPEARVDRFFVKFVTALRLGSINNCKSAICRAVSILYTDLLIELLIGL